MITIPLSIFYCCGVLLCVKLGEMLIEYIERDKYPYTGDTTRLDRTKDD